MVVEMIEIDHKEAKINAIKEYLLKNGILIGSRKWGGVHKDSDYDLVFSAERWIKLSQRLDKYNDYFFIDYFPGSSAGATNRMFNIENIKIRFPGGQVYNILTYKEEDIQKILYLNEAMETLQGTEIMERAIDDKNVRIELVETFLNILFYKKHSLEEKIPF